MTPRHTRDESRANCGKVMSDEEIYKSACTRTSVSEEILQ